MNTLEQSKENMGGITWEPEHDSTPPLHEESILIAQKTIQSTITKHSLVDRDLDWSDIPFKLPLLVTDAKSSKVSTVKTRKAIKKSELAGGQVEQGKNKQLTQSFGKYFLWGLDLAVRSVSTIIKFIFTSILYILGIKKIPKKRRAKRKVNANSAKRRARAAPKNNRSSKSVAVSSKPRAESRASTLNWKKLDVPFLPSSNLYCYWCTKKLGLKSWELDGHYYCDSCHSSKNVNLR